MIGEKLLKEPGTIDGAVKILMELGFAVSPKNYIDIQHAKRLVQLNNEVYKRNKSIDYLLDTLCDSCPCELEDFTDADWCEANCDSEPDSKLIKKCWLHYAELNSPTE